MVVPVASGDEYQSYIDTSSRSTLVDISQGWLQPAESTQYNTSIITHNRPTTRESVRDGEAASIINVTMFNENWANGYLADGTPGQAKMTFAGSLVVMDSRRYTRNYLLQGPKEYGLFPLGYHGDSASE